MGAKTVSGLSGGSSGMVNGTDFLILALGFTKDTCD